MIQDTTLKYGPSARREPQIDIEGEVSDARGDSALICQFQIFKTDLKRTLPEIMRS
jgi:hypothetical protein